MKNIAKHNQDVLKHFYSRECLEIASDTDPIGPTVGIKYNSPGLDISPRKLYRDNLDLFSPESATSKIPLEGQENKRLRKISREELGYPLRGDSRKVSHEEPQVETQARKISREEPLVSTEALLNPVYTKEPEVPVDFKMIPRSLPIDPSYSSIRLSIREKLDSPMDPYLGIRYMDDAEVNVGSLRRKMFKERKDPSGESLSKMIPIDECVTDSQSQDFDVEMDITPRLMIREETQKGHILLKDKPLDSASTSPLRDEHGDSVLVDGQRVKVRDNKELPKERFHRKVLRDELGLSMDKGKLLRGISMDNTFRKKAGDDLDTSMERPRGMSLRERRDKAVSMKLSRDERDVVTERQRLFRDIKIDNTLDTREDNIQRDDTPVEPVRQKISRDEFVVPDPRRFSQPDLTIDSLILCTPPSDPLSHLVYDGILEKSYQSPLNVTSPGDLSHPASAPSMSASSQSLVSSDGAGSSSSQSGNLSPAESRSGNKGKKTLKLKNLFKKKKDKEKDKDSKREHPQGGLQKL